MTWTNFSENKRSQGGKFGNFFETISLKYVIQHFQMYARSIKCPIQNIKDCSCRDHFVFAVLYFLFEDNYKSKHCLYFPSQQFSHILHAISCQINNHLLDQLGGETITHVPRKFLSWRWCESLLYPLGSVYIYSIHASTLQILRLTLWQKGLRCAWSGLTGPMRSSWPQSPDTSYWAMIIWHYKINTLSVPCCE